MRKETMEPRQMNTQQAAAYLGLSPHTLNQWRYQGRGPQFLRMGRAIRYPKGALDTYMENSIGRSSLNL